MTQEYRDVIKYVVYDMEYEAGWGVRVDETLKFNTEEEARAYVESFNSKKSDNPSWSMWAEFIGPKIFKEKIDVQ